MGAQQSQPLYNLPPLASEDVPYTSYSVERQKSQRDSREFHQRNQQVTVKSQDVTSKKANDIVVVAEGSSPKLDSGLNVELQKMHDIPTFLPIMRGTLNVPSMEDPNVLDKLDSSKLYALSVRYQEHLKSCSEAVTFDQNSLTQRVKEIDSEISAITNTLSERQKKFAKYAEHIQKINEMSSTVKRIQMAVDQLIPTMNMLNSMLPETERLEQFKMKNEGTGRR
ncbi:BLOC-1-related complex subunit 5-like [Anneissia japonica]|uniref:BLOC-1-related complex subunit 5-like n=1 Tax=Anneissia japonica TaxID=1529436 RepID=UPI0014255878|nr:BLOC-1-related complex subunit 5-like [Anneissia japonica]